jgi:Zn-dependent protease with chaperone function
VAPGEWARLCALALGGGAALVELVLVVHAAPPVLRAAGVPLIAAACERMLGPLVPGGVAVGWAAAAAAVTLPVLGSIGLQRARRQRRVLRVERELGRHHRHGDHELVVLPTERFVAVSVPGRPRGQVVVSEGLVDSLAPDELEAVVGHEAAHLDRRHDRYLLLATAVEHACAFFPPARRSTAALRASLERWADEDAAGASAASRQALRRALLGVTVALVAEPSVAAFTTAETVLERLDALDTAAPSPSPLLRASLYLPGAALAVLAGVTLLSCGADAQTVVASAGACCT